MSSLKTLIVYNTLSAKLRFKYVTWCEFSNLNIHNINKIHYLLSIKNDILESRI